MKLSATDLKDMQLFKYYRLVRKWACKTYGIKEADLELLIYLESVNIFSIKDFKDAVYAYSWDKDRWERLRREGWIDIWRKRNMTTMKYSLFKVSFKTKQMTSRVYRVLLGDENIPVTEKSVYYKNKSYTDKVFNKAVDDMIKDKER
jgi:hypothetical protein